VVRPPDEHLPVPTCCGFGLHRLGEGIGMRWSVVYPACWGWSEHCVMCCSGWSLAAQVAGPSGEVVHLFTGITDALLASLKQSISDLVTGAD
jgi:hypothetical protein